MSGPSASSTRRGSATRRWTTASAPARTPRRCNASVTGSAQGHSKASSGAGSGGFRRRSPPLTCVPGYVYDIAFRQLETSDTLVFDRRQAGRSFFEGVIRDPFRSGPSRPGGVDLRASHHPLHPGCPRRHRQPQPSGPSMAAPPPLARRLHGRRHRCCVRSDRT